MQSVWSKGREARVDRYLGKTYQEIGRGGSQGLPTYSEYRGCSGEISPWVGHGKGNRPEVSG